MGLLYRIVTALIYFVFWPYGRLRAAFGNRLWRGRLGLIEKIETTDIWLHASSAGETKIAGYLVGYLLRKNPNLKIYLSTMTVAGQRIAADFKSKLTEAGFFPIDSAGAIKRSFAKINPKLLVITETEIWPNLINEAKSRNIPIILVNGRMSDKAMGKYVAVRRFISGLLGSYDRIFVKSETDKEKFESFNISAPKLVVGGDMKFDAPIIERDNAKVARVRERIGANDTDFVLVAGSTRPGEEKLLVQLYEKLNESANPIKLVIAPRHLDRLEQIKQELSSKNIPHHIYGQDSADVPVVLIDKMGLLTELYQAADLAFVGGTLVDVGGHNILEPVWAGTPVIFGPFVGNIIEAKEYITDNNFGMMADSIEQMTDLVSRFIENRKMFAIKSGDDLSHSPTAMAGDYILERLRRV